jgi:hypothetical protein
MSLLLDFPVCILPDFALLGIWKSCLKPIFGIPDISQNEWQFSAIFWTRTLNILRDISPLKGKVRTE